MIYMQRNREMKIVFLGDSITEYGWNEPNGYVRQVENKLKNTGKKISIISAGIAGNTSQDMLNRLEKDVIGKKPDIMYFMGGVNDIWLEQGDLNKYKQNIKDITEKTKKHHIKVILINLTLIGEDLDNDLNKKIEKFNDFLSEFAKSNNIRLIDVHSELVKELKNPENENKKNEDGNILTIDGVHLNDFGNAILADKIVEEYLQEH